MQQHNPTTPSITINGNESPKVHAPPGEVTVIQEAHTSNHIPVNPRPGTDRWLLAAVLLLVICLGATFFLVNRQRAGNESAIAAQTDESLNSAPPVNVVTVQFGPSTHAVLLPGETRAWYESTIYARVNGYLKKWLVDIGDQVHAGQVLATIETPELDQQLTAAQAKVSACKAQINLAEANKHFTEVTLARYKDAPKGVVSDIERDERSADYQISMARVTSAESDLNSAEAEVDRLHAMIEFQKVTAPFDGVITERRVDIGDLVTAGSTASTTSLFRIAQYNQLRVFVDVPQQTAMEIHDGDNATAIWNGQSFTGRVARTSRAIDPAVKTLRVEVDIPNTSLALLPGMYLQDVQFNIKDAKPALQIPASALNFRSTGPQVAVVGDDGRVTFRTVTISRDLGSTVEIGEGLSEGDCVALNISNQIADGDVVKPNKVELPGEGAPASPRAVTMAAPVSHIDRGIPARSAGVQ